MNKAFKFRIYPNQEQTHLIILTLGHNRFLWNKMLEDKRNYYQTTGSSIYTLPAKYKEKYSFLKEVDSLSLANTQLNLDKAFKAFNTNKSKYPAFKKKVRDYGYTTNLVNNNIELLDGYIKVPKLGLVKIKKHRSIPSNMKLKNITISRAPTNKYYVSINYEYLTEIKKQLVHNIVGLDFSMNNFYVDNNGNTSLFPKSIMMDFKKLRRLQRKYTRQKNDGANKEKTRLQIALVHERITNKRNDFLHKLSNEITNHYDSVCVETLDIKELMISNKYYAKQLSNYGWNTLIKFLEYKLDLKGKSLIKVNKWYPSSKICSNCGSIKSDLKLHERTYKCSECGHVQDRDLNAAINIKNEGLRLLGV
jgi:putative transposase